MKKTVFLFLISFIMLTVCGCNNSKTVTEQVVNGYYKPIEYEISTLNNTQSDIFVGEIIAEKTLPENTEFINIKGIKKDAVLYTVKIKEGIWGISTVDGATVQVVKYVDNNKDNPLWTASFEVGKTYLISGLVQPYKDKAVIVDTGVLSAQINKNDAITALSALSEKLLKNIPTYTALIKTEQMQSLIKTKKAILPDAFINYQADTKTADINAIGVLDPRLDEEQILKIVKTIQKDVTVS